MHSVDNCIKFGGSRGFLSRVWGFSAGSLALAPHSFSTCCLMPQTPLSIRISWTFYLEAEGPKRAKVKVPGLFKHQSPYWQSATSAAFIGHGKSHAVGQDWPDSRGGKWIAHLDRTSVMCA